MILSERHIISNNDSRFKVIDAESYKSKNLYNSTVYAIRQHYFQTKEFLRYATLQHTFQCEGQSDYRALPSSGIIRYLILCIKQVDM